MSAIDPSSLGPRAFSLPAPDSDFEIPHPLVARMALEILWEEVISAVPGDPEVAAVSKAIYDLHELLWRKEAECVAETGLTAHYLIIRPVNPMNMPSPEDATAIGAAIATLSSHGLISRPWCDDD